MAKKIDIIYIQYSFTEDAENKIIQISKNDKLSLGRNPSCNIVIDH